MRQVSNIAVTVILVAGAIWIGSIALGKVRGA